MTAREGVGSLPLPLAASLLLHAAVLGLVALGLPRGLPQQETSLEVRLVSLEAEGGAGPSGGEAAVGAPAAAGRALQPRTGAVGRSGAPQPGEGQPAGAPRGPAASAAPSLGASTGEAPPAGPESPAGQEAPVAAPAPAASAADRVAAREPLAIEGPKVTTPDRAFSTPSGFDLPQGSPGREGDLASSAAARLGGGATAPQEEGVAGEPRGVPDGKGLAGGSVGGVAQIAGSLAATRGSGPGAGDGPGGPGSGTGRGETFARILGRIEAAKRYPEEARRLGHRGTVAVRFRIGPDGAVAAAEVAATSGSSLLDAASLETVRRAAPLPQTPGWLLVRISYGLTEARP